MAVPENIDTEALLIFQLKQGSSKAFDKIYQMYGRRLYAYCLQFTKSPEDSEEIVQDVFVKLWTNREQVRQKDTLRSLLFIMAKHHLISAYRSNINRPVYEEYVNYKEAAAVDNTDQQLEYRDFIAKFKQAMQTLPATQRKVIALSKIKELSNEEIAEKLALSEQTVKNALSAGLKTLKAELDKIYFLYMALLFVNFCDFAGFYGTI
ncbi:MAG: RNA polymerase sigma-70 factor [Tannerella sp.]|jgi:RNA polymerase sigma-70 factor (ECF subfamily)|nr:RNA polymerase sigma-70 factor [Tannerella sp.]